MRHYEGSPVIAPGPKAVRAGLTDGAAWPSWDSAVGQVAPDEKITTRARAAPGRSFPVGMAGFDPSARLRFGGNIPLGLSGGAQIFEVPPDGHGGTAFHAGEERTGPRLGLIWRSVPNPGPSSGRFAGGPERRVETGC